MREQEAIQAARDELRAATEMFGPFASPHEGFAILKEEVDELWEAVRMKQSDSARPACMRDEARQVAAMALRFLIDCCDE